MFVGLARRIHGSEFRMLSGVPCSELLAFMDSNVKSGDSQDFPLLIPYWWDRLWFSDGPG